jgi:hypothetical protein
MAPQTGTFTLADLLAVRFQSVNDFGADTVIQVLREDLAAHNAIVNEMIMDMAAFTTDTQDIYGTGTAGEMVEVDELGRSDTQKPAPGSTVGFPLRLFQYGIGWTAKYMETATPADLAQGQLAAEQAHMKALRRDIKRALFGATNYTWNDFLINNVAIGVKRLVNADSAAIPEWLDLHGQQPHPLQRLGGAGRNRGQRRHHRPDRAWPRGQSHDRYPPHQRGGLCGAHRLRRCRAELRPGACL